MSLTTIKEPAALKFSKNPIWYRFLSGNYLTSVGAKAKYDLVFDSHWVGLYFHLTFNGKKYRFDCVTSPDGSGYQFRSYVSQPAFNNMVNDFKALYELNKHFTLTSVWNGGAFDKIVLEAKEPGAIWNIQISDGGARFMLNTVTVGTDNVYNPNYKVFCDLHIQSDPTIAPVDNLVAQLDADAHKDNIVLALAANEFVFDIELQNLIHANLSAYIPAWNLAAVTKATNMLLSFWIRCGEIYGVDPKVLWNDYNGAANAYKQVIIGGLELDETTFTVIPDYTGTKLLNRQPTTKVVSKACPEYLYKYVLAAHTDLQLRCTVTYTDGTTTTALVGTAVATSLARNVYVFPAGWDTLNLGALQPSKTATKYTLHVSNNALAVLSDTQTYFIDYTEHEVTNRLLFLGACGAMETVYLTGSLGTEIQSDSEPITSVKTPWYDRGTALLQHTNSTQNARLKFNSGFKSLAYITWLKELAHSDVVLLQENGYWASIRIDKKTIKDMPTNLDDLYAISFEAERIIHL